MNTDKDTLLRDLLKKHIGHKVSVVCYGDDQNPTDICLECEDCDEVVLDAELYTITARDEEETK